MKLDGKIALVTGGSSGIGLAAAQRFVAEGAHVFITGRREMELERARAAIGRNVSTVCGDVASLDDLDRLFARIEAEKGVLDVLVANAGIFGQETTAEATPEFFDQMFAVNVRGVYFSVAKAQRLMTRGGSIVLVSSGMHMRGVAGNGAYAASKAAVRSLGRTWAAEFKDRGIRVNTLSPGIVETPIHPALQAGGTQADKVREMLQTMVPMARLGTVEEMAAAILFLASDDSSYSTGIDLVADGGITQL